MILGDSFPKDLVLASIRRHIQPGAILKFRFVMDDGQEQEKRFLVLAVDDETLTCVINSNIPQLALKTPALLTCQVKLDRSRHEFMDWDSHIDCSRVRRYPTVEIEGQLIQNKNWILGKLHSELRDEVLTALKFSITESPVIINNCCAALSSADLER